MNRVLVIVVTYNSMKCLDKCLSSLGQSSESVDVIVIDNGSTDGTPAYIKENYPDIYVKEAGSNLGFGAANNIGIRNALASGYEFVYLLNSDAWILPDTISNLLEAFEKDSRLGILSPIQMTSDLKRQDHRFSKWYNRRKPLANGISDVPFVMAAHWMIPCEVIRKVGLFSPAFRHYGEDDNYIDRLHYFGYWAGVVENASGVHDRENRSESKEQRMKLKTVAATVKLSNPNRPFTTMLLRELLELCAMSIKNGSLIPMKFIPYMLCHRKELRKYRNASTMEGAFI